MTNWNRKLKQENMQDDLLEIMAYIQKEPNRTNYLMKPSLAGCNEAEQTITIEFPVQEWQLNPSSMMHGGMIATAFDEALGIMAVYLSGGKRIVSVNLSLNFQKPVPMGESILIEAKATSSGKRLITVSGECRLKDGGLLTNTAIGTFAIINS